MLGLAIYLIGAAALVILAAVSTATYNKKMDTQPALADKSTKKIIGIRNARLHPEAPSGLNVAIFDTSTYYDRALVQLLNDTGGGTALMDFSIVGQLVVEISGRSGFSWQASDWAAIERDGEQEFRLGNDFIMDAGQVESIGDWLQKELRPHDCYRLKIAGTHPYFEVGDLYTMTFTHQLPASLSEIESHDIDVQIRGVAFERNVGSLGSTVLIVRVPTGAWSKTTTRRARLSAVGLPFRDISRTNVVTVASRDYAGAADYYCDGTDDQVEILAAIAYVGGQGGGLIQLTAGTFSLTETGSTNISIAVASDNIKIVGEGQNATILTMAFSDDAEQYIINNTAGDGTSLTVCDMAFTGTGTYTHRGHALTMSSATGGTEHVENVKISNLGRGIQASGGKAIVRGCNISIIDSADAQGIYTAATNFNIESNTIIFADQTIASTARTGITVAANNGGNISNNKITLNGHDTGEFLVIYVNARGAVVANNTIVCSGSYSSYIEGIYVGASGNIITGNKLVGADFNSATNSYGIAIAANDCIITNNNITSFTDTGAGTGYGIYITAAADRTLVTGNTSLNNDDNYEDTGSNTVSGNNITA